MNIYFIQNISKIHKYHKSGIFSEHPMNFFTLFSLSLFASPVVGAADQTLTSCTHPFHRAHLAAAWEYWCWCATETFPSWSLRPHPWRSCCSGWPSPSPTHMSWCSQSSPWLEIQCHKYSWTSSIKSLLFFYPSPSWMPSQPYIHFLGSSLCKRTYYCHKLHKRPFDQKAKQWNTVKKCIFTYTLCYHSLKYNGWNLNHHFHIITQHFCYLPTSNLNASFTFPTCLLCKF